MKQNFSFDKLKNNKKIFFVFDDITQPNEKIKYIIGEKKFSEIVINKKSLFENLKDIISEFDFVKSINLISKISDIDETIMNVEKSQKDTSFIHMYSHFAVTDKDEFSLIINKSCYINKNILVKNKTKGILLFSNQTEYLNFLSECKKVLSTQIIPQKLTFTELTTHSLLDISNISSFTTYISSSFNTRYFNSINGDDNIIIKTSSNKKKIKSEYQFYHLLPDSMKSWFVIPYNFTETEKTASYLMKRYHMTDMSIRWIHGSIDIFEMDNFLQKIFWFINSRTKIEIPKNKFIERRDNLYLEKTHHRISELKSTKKFFLIDSFIKAGTNFDSIDEIIDEYKILYLKSLSKSKPECIAVIGHGDLCFSNILYNNDIELVKMIDPKGALSEKDLWQDPYYDIAKLSHSICGLYDLYNNNMFNIILGDDFKLKLEVNFNNSEFVQLFKKHLDQNGFDFELIRLFEASLFLSMLPLHIENPKKVFAFLLNAINILNEVKQCIQK